MRTGSFVSCLCAIASAGLVGCATTPASPPPPPAPPVPQELVQIQDWEDHRSLGDGQLTRWAVSAPDPSIRARSLLALARLQDPATASVVAQALTDREPLPRYQAAFAAGALGLSWTPLPEDVRTLLTRSLSEAEAVEKDPAVRLAQLKALGRIATPAAVERLTDRLTDAAADVRARAALSLGIAAKREAVLPARAITLLVPMLKADAPVASRFGAAYALAVSKAAAVRPWLLLCARDAESEIRALCAKGLGEVAAEPDAVTLRALLDDPDYRVAVEATRALAKLAGRCRAPASCPAVGALAGLRHKIDRLERGDLPGGGQPLLALAQQPLPASLRPLLVTLRAAVVAAKKKVGDPILRDDLATLDCRLAAALDAQQGTLAEVLSCGDGSLPEARRIALGLRQWASVKPAGAKLDAVRAHLRHPDAAVKAAALEVIASSQDASLAAEVRPLIESADLVVASAAAQAATQLKDREALPAVLKLAAKLERSPDLAPSVASALGGLGGPQAEAALRAWLESPHAAMRDGAAEALTKLTGRPVYPVRGEPPARRARAPVFPKESTLQIRTEKGSFEVKLYTAEAPLNTANLIALARKGFYRNLTFHRVVPDFVAQGGDPRGDGEGGPGYTVRCEVSHKPYARGVVGIALSGKDTGGSQFFVTTSPQPHLDGRYTAVGEVTRGQEVIDRLFEGDRILEVRAL